MLIWNMTVLIFDKTCTQNYIVHYTIKCVYTIKFMFVHIHMYIIIIIIT